MFYLGAPQECLKYQNWEGKNQLLSVVELRCRDWKSKSSAPHNHTLRCNSQCWPFSFPLNSTLLLSSLCFISCVEPEVPYDVELVAGSGVGCGETIRSDLTFTREGG